MVMQGSKIGKRIQRSSIKNIINFEQERDRQRIHETNVGSEYAINKLRAGDKHAQANRANTPGGTQRYGKLPDKTSDPELFIYRPSFTAQIIGAAFAEADRKTERAVDGVINTVNATTVVSQIKEADSNVKDYLKKEYTTVWENSNRTGIISCNLQPLIRTARLKVSEGKIEASMKS